MKDVAKHLNHPFYADASNYREHIRLGQILKGAEKYDEPYKPENYTLDEQIEHFMQENVDQAHYAYGLYVNCKKLMEENRELKRQLTIVNQELEETNGILNSLRK
jgi:hypothetical protein